MFLAFNPKSIYTKGCLLWLALIEHWTSNNLSAVHYLSTSIYAFNEEHGEAGFAVLGRTVLGDSDRSRFSKLQKAYQAQPLFQALSRPSSDQVARPQKDQGNSASLQLVKRHLASVLSQLEKGTWLPLDKQAISRSPSFKLKSVALCPLTEPDLVSPDSLVPKCFSKLLKAAIKDVNNLLKS